MHIQREDERLRVQRRLRGLIESRGWSIKDFANASGLPYRTVQDYLAGRRMPGIEQLRLIRRAGVDLNWLVTGTFIMKFGKLEIFANGFVADLLGEELELADHISEIALDGVLKYSARRVQAGYPHISPRKMIYAWIFYCRALLNAVDAAADKISEMRKTGARSEDILDLIGTAFSEDFDKRVTTMLEAIVGE